MKKRKLFLTTAIILITVMSIFNVVLLSGCEKIVRAIYDTPEENEKQISKLVEKQYVKEGKCDSFDIYPLYDINDEVKYFMVDLHPQAGILYVYATPLTRQKIIGIWYPAVSQYEWYRYRYVIDEATANYDGGHWQFQPDNIYDWRGEKTMFTGILREVSEDGELLEYQKFVSPYHVAEVLDEKLYLLIPPFGLIPAVKRDGKFFNLISMEYIEDINSSEMQETLLLHFPAKYTFSDLK